MELLNTNLNTNHGSFIETVFASELAKLRDEKLINEFNLPLIIRAVNYLRVSTIEQARKDKGSLKEQEKQTNELIKRNGWVLVDTYRDEGKSGTKAEGRDAYLKLKEDAKLNKFDVVVFWDFDRFGRNTGEMLTTMDELRRCGVQITSVNCPIEIDSPKHLNPDMNSGQEMLTVMQAVIAKQENRKRVLRMMLGKMDNARKGLIPCRVPYGYKKIVRYIGGQKTRKFQKVIIDKTQTAIVQKIFDLYDKNSWGMRKIAEHLNLGKVPAAQGGLWEYTSVRYILTNFTYTGLVRWGWYLSRTKEKRLQLTDGGGKGIIEKGSHPIIIDKEQFQRVQKKLNNKQKIGGRAASSVGLLVGIAKCGRCGGGSYVTRWPHWFAYQHSKKDREKYTDTFSYLCTNYSRFGKSGCTGRYVMSKGKLENAVVKKIEELADSKEAQEAFINKMKQSNKSQILREIDSITFALKDIEKRAIRQKMAYDSGVTSLKDWKDDMTKNENDKLELNGRLEAKRIELTQETKQENQSRKSLLALANFKKVWKIADFVTKKDLLRTILEKVVVKGNQIEVLFAHN